MCECRSAICPNLVWRFSEWCRAPIVNVMYAGVSVWDESYEDKGCCVLMIAWRMRRMALRRWKHNLHLKGKLGTYRMPPKGRTKDEGTLIAHWHSAAVAFCRSLPAPQLPCIYIIYIYIYIYIQICSGWWGFAFPKPPFPVSLWPPIHFIVLEFRVLGFAALA